MARDLGVRGQTWNIIETDLLVHLKARASDFVTSGRLANWQKDAERRTRSYVNAPNPVAGIGKATERRSRLFDPSMTVRSDILDHQGQTLAKAGTTINPLDYLPLSTALLFIDGNDPKQVDWALKVERKNKIILTSGPVAALMRRHKRPLYFDQKGLITSRFAITAVPAAITQEGRALRIREFPVPGGQIK